MNSANARPVIRDCRPANVWKAPRSRLTNADARMTEVAEKQPTIETLIVSQSALVRFIQPRTAQAHYSNKAAVVLRSFLYRHAGQF